MLRALRRSLLLATLVAIAVGCGGVPARHPEPTPATARLLDSARAAERDRDYLRARDLYERAIEAATDRESRAAATRELADALIFWGQYRDAATTLENLTALSPRDPGAWHNLGLVRYRLGHIDAAERALRQAITLAPEDPRPRIAIAALYVNQRRHADAIREYNALLALEDVPDRIRAAARRAIHLLRDDLAQ